MKERKERGDLITIYKLMNNLEETDRKNLILRTGEAKNLRGQEKIAKRNLLRYKKYRFPSKIRYFGMD